MRDRNRVSRALLFGLPFVSITKRFEPNNPSSNFFVNFWFFFAFALARAGTRAMRSHFALLACMAGAAAAAASSDNSTAGASSDCVGINAVSPACSSSESAYKRDVFYVGGQYVTYGTSYIRSGQLYVEKLTPAAGATKPYPLVFISAGVPSGNVWLNTPDNRKGWASLFLDEGYLVYVVDITANGRSGQNDLASYPLKLSTTVTIHEDDYTAPELIDPYPQSLGHDQWVGNGTKGDPIFDAFFAAAGPLTSNTTSQELSMRYSGCTLLELLGVQAYLVSHSAGATYASLMSDECPARVRATINLEPGNTPFQSLVGNSTVPAVGRTISRPWGLTNTAITYAPPVVNASDPTAEILTVEVGADLPGYRMCYLQDVASNTLLNGTARQLTQISKVPYVMFTAANSPHITYDHCMYTFLQQAGVDDLTWVKFGEDKNITGNGHFFYLESNSDELFTVVAEEIEKRN